jgi:hypothetical protein
LAINNLRRGKRPKSLPFYTNCGSWVSVLGRDVLATFDIVVSQRRNQVLLLIGKDTYAVTG